MPVDERRHQGTDDEAAGDVDRERAPGEDRGDAALDQAVEGIAGEASECASGGDGEEDGHAGSFEVVGAISRAGG